MKICLVLPVRKFSYDNNGISQYTYNIAKGLVKKGCEVHIIKQTYDEDRDYKKNDLYIHKIVHPNIFFLDKHYKNRIVYVNKFPYENSMCNLRYSRKVYKKIISINKKRKLDIVEGPNFSTPCLIFSFWKQNIPLVTRYHIDRKEVVKYHKYSNYDVSVDDKVRFGMQEKLEKNSDGIVSSTQKYTDILKKEYDSKKVSCVPLGVPIKKGRKIEDFSKKKSKVNILFVGRLEKRKGIHILMQSIPKVLKREPSLEFDIVGKDSFISEEGSTFENKFFSKLSLNTRKKVNILGYLNYDLVEKYYRKCDIFVVSSLFETFGLVYLEAMSYGKPVIACNTGGVPEVVENGKVGILVPPGDVKELSKAIVKLSKNKNLREQMGINAKNYVRNNYNIDKVTERTINNYSKIIENNNARYKGD